MRTAQWVKTRRSGLLLRAYLKIEHSHTAIRLTGVEIPSIVYHRRGCERQTQALHKSGISPRKNAKSSSEMFCLLQAVFLLYCNVILHSPTCNTLSTQPPSSRVTPRRKGSWVSSLLSPLVPLSSPPALKEEYIQISFSLLGNDQ